MSQQIEYPFERLTHDLLLYMNVHLNGIVGPAELLLNDETGALNDSQREHLETIIRDGQYARILNADMVDIAKLKLGIMPLDIVSTDANVLIHDVVSFVKERHAKRAIDIQYEIQPDFPIISVDPNRLRHVLINLISYLSYLNSKISIKANLAEIAGIPAIQFNVSFVDSSMSERTEKLLLLLNQSDTDSLLDKNLYTLFIAKNLVQLLGGRFWADSESKNSIAIHFTLPLHQPE